MFGFCGAAASFLCPFVLCGHRIEQCGEKRRNPCKYEFSAGVAGDRKSDGLSLRPKEGSGLGDAGTASEGGGSEDRNIFWICIDKESVDGADGPGDLQKSCSQCAKSRECGEKMPAHTGEDGEKHHVATELQHCLKAVHNSGIEDCKIQAQSGCRFFYGNAGVLFCAGGLFSGGAQHKKPAADGWQVENEISYRYHLLDTERFRQNITADRKSVV